MPPDPVPDVPLPAADPPPQNGAASPARPGPDAGAPPYRPKFRLRHRDRIATAGCCTARHFTQALREQGFRLPAFEAPLPGMSPALARRHGYGDFPVRCGPVTTARQFLQLVRDAQDGTVRPDDMVLRNGRWIDTLRPTVTTPGFPSREAARAARLSHLRRVRRMLGRMDVLILTLATDMGAPLPGAPSAPGTRAPAGPASGAMIRADLAEAARLLRARRPGLRILLSVSPAPPDGADAPSPDITATLRAACTALATGDDGIAYFPALDILTAGPDRLDATGRVTDAGRAAVLEAFLAAHPPPPARAPRPATAPLPAEDEDADADHCADILQAAMTGGRP